MTTYTKVRFSSYCGATFGLVLETDKLRAMSVADVSRMFPWSEVPKMKMLEQSKPYPSWEAAFAHDFDAREG